VAEAAWSGDRLTFAARSEGQLKEDKDAENSDCVGRTAALMIGGVFISGANAQIERGPAALAE
jgi:hypothetical protein